MAKIINFPTLCKLTEDEKNELVVQVLELREKMNSIVDVISHQQMTNNLRQGLHDELVAVQSKLANAAEVVRSAYTRKK